NTKIHTQCGTPIYHYYRSLPYVAAFHFPSCTSFINIMAQYVEKATELTSSLHTDNEHATCNHNSQDRQRLVDDIFWLIAKHYLDKARDIFALARSNRNLWALLHHEMLAMHTLEAKRGFEFFLASEVTAGMLQKIIDSKLCDLDERDEWGFAALQHALQRGRGELAALLLYYGAKPERSPPSTWIRRGPEPLIVDEDDDIYWD
ncbi:hypothetical protein F5B20DRAFT_594970, partial [Whalleya microplaca]